MTAPLLTLLTLPQRVRPGKLSLRFLLAPTRDPLAPIAGGLAAFADLPATLTLRLLAGPGGLPRPADGDVLATVDLAPAPDTRPMFEALAAGLPIDATPPPATDPALGRLRILKVATDSYLTAIGAHRRGSPFLVSPETYACAMRDMLEPGVAAPRRGMPADISWNRLFAHMLRRPPFAAAAGMIRLAEIDIADPDRLVDGGFVWAEPADGSPLAAMPPGDLKTYAARLPRLEADADRPLFAAVLFPVAAAPPAATAGAYDEIFAEAAAYDDGFAKAVHAFQHERHDPMGVSGAGLNGMQPIQDRGVRLGWDDEQILDWFNRQAAEDPRNPAPQRPSRDAPLAVAGYRIDVREAGEAPGPWTSLVKVTAALRVGGVTLPDFAGEFFVQPSPSLQQRVGSGGAARDQFWLLPHLARWPGGSLLGAAAVDRMPGDAEGPEPQVKPDPVDAVPLRYGRVYDFRVRLADVTGGGPSADDEPVNGAPQSVARLRYRRFAPPDDVRIERDDPDAEEITRVRLWRPYVTLPDAHYVESAIADPMAAVAADAPAAAAEGRRPGLPDPDVRLVRIDLYVASPEGDPVNEAIVGVARRRLGGPIVREFPNDPAAPLALTFRFADAASIDGFATADGQDILLPSSRDVIAVVRPIARQDPAEVAAGRDDPLFAGPPDDPRLMRSDPTLDYFGCQAARVGPPATLALRAPAGDERGLIAPAGGTPLLAVLAAPGRLATGLSDAAAASMPPDAALQADAASRLAAQLGLQASGSTFIAPPDASRTVLACTSLLAHVASADRSRLTMGAGEALADVWVVAIRLQLERDWTWDGLEALEIWRNEEGGGETLAARVALPRAVPAATGAAADRQRTELLFFDRVAPMPPGAPHPVERSISYRATAVLRQPADQPPEDWRGAITLPIAVAPVDRPNLVSTGIAAGPYRADERYSATAPRDRMLWLEFAEPPSNPADHIYARVLAWAPDPTLGDGLPPLPEAADPPLGIPEEAIRTIVPDQVDDRAGAGAMQPLIPTTSDRCFLLPLPPGVEAGSPELLGFFRYEFRVGHGPSSWSTARARFGAPARHDGLRHPPPDLAVGALRLSDRLVAAAHPARAENPDHPVGPRRMSDTEVWFLLYAQAPRADGSVMRNILLSRRRGVLAEMTPLPGQSLQAQAEWRMEEVLARLDELALDARAGLSVLGVELLPTPGFRFPDPLAGDLGEVRVLRTSTLVPVPARCVE